MNVEQKEILCDIRKNFERICDFIEGLGVNSYDTIILDGTEYEVGSHTDNKYKWELFVPHRGTLYYEDLQSIIPDLFRLAMGDKWVEEVDWS